MKTTGLLAGYLVALSLAAQSVQQLSLVQVSTQGLAGRNEDAGTRKVQNERGGGPA